uniref:C2H2-type domain-containing protein n=1 Tax=Meloidogyne javanica TaxID=6303 RepID=A0A915N972_MELJA
MPGRAQSATLLNNNRRESPPINSFNNSKTSIQKQEELQQFLCSSTPASVNNNNNLGGGSTNNSAANSSNLLETSPTAADSFSTDQQLMGQCLMQHLASQLGLSSSQSGGERSSIIEQLIDQLLGSNFSPNSAASSLLLPAFGALNNTEMDNATMLAKLSAELASVSQASQQQHGSSGLLFQNGLSLGQSGQVGSKPPPPKRQYSSTSKNFCDLCNKEVCNKYFLRTHMLKMHNIVIDENKLVIANIDTSEKERRGEVKFRCEICLASLTGREQLRAHKREVHGMQAPLGGGGGGHASTSSTPSSSIGKLPILAPLLPSSLTGVVEMTAADGQKHKICQSPTTIKRTNNLNNEEEEDGDGDREGGMYPIKRPKIENDEEDDEEISKFRRRGGSGGETDEVTDEMMLQLLQRWEGENGHNEVTVSSEGDLTTSSSQSPLPEELVAYLPVRSMLLEPLKLTLELRPNPQNTDSLIRDQQHQHLENQKPILRKMENFEMCDNNSYGAGNEVVPSSVP